MAEQPRHFVIVGLNSVANRIYTSEAEAHEQVERMIDLAIQRGWEEPEVRVAELVYS